MLACVLPLTPTAQPITRVKFLDLMKFARNLSPCGRIFQYMKGLVAVRLDNGVHKVRALVLSHSRGFRAPALLRGGIVSIRQRLQEIAFSFLKLKIQPRHVNDGCADVMGNLTFDSLQ